MSAIVYTAHTRAPLMAGHAVGNSYGFDIKFRAYNRPINAPKNMHFSLDGTSETILTHVKPSYSIVIGSFGDADQEQIDEFIYSIAGGDIFTIDLNGSVASPDSPVSVKATNKVFNPQRVGVNRYTMVLSLVTP